MSSRRRLQDHLELVVVLQPVGVLAVAAVLRPARGLHIGGVPGLRPERAQRGRGMEGAGADLHVVGLQDDAALIRPIALQRQDQALERALRAHVGGKIVAHGDSGRSGRDRRAPVCAHSSRYRVTRISVGALDLSAAIRRVKQRWPTGRMRARRGDDRATPSLRSPPWPVARRTCLSPCIAAALRR